MSVTEQTLVCTNHPQRETVLRCGKCDRPFCTDCLVQTPVGQRCRPCANIRPSPIYTVSPARLILGLAAGMGTAIVLGLLLFGMPVISAFALWLSPVYGIAVGEAVSVATRGKRGPVLQLVTVLSVLVGAVAGKYGLFVVAFAGRVGADLALAQVSQSMGRDIWLMLFIVIAVVVGQTRVR